MMELPAHLVLCGLDTGQQLLDSSIITHGQQCRSTVSSVGRAGAQSNPRTPDFEHKVRRKALWVDGRSNPPWVKPMLKSVIQGKLQFHGCTKFMQKSEGKICGLSGPRATTSKDTLVKKRSYGRSILRNLQSGGITLSQNQIQGSGV